MPLLREEANKLTLPSLQRGVIEVLITRGARELLQDLPFKRFEGESYAFNREATLPTSASARDPYGTSIPGGVGTRQRVAVEAGMLARNADTAKIDVVGKSNINNQRTNDIILAAKKLAQDFVNMYVNGVHDVSGVTTDYNLRGLEHWLGFNAPAFPEQLVFADTNGNGTGTRQALSLTLIDDLTTRYKGEGFKTIYSDRQTLVAFMNLLNLAGGNVAAMFMKDNYGEPVFAYRGVRWYVLDAVGAGKTAAAGTVATNGAFTITSAQDLFWTGFSSIDVGRQVTVGASNFTIASVTGPRSATVTAPPAAAVTGAVSFGQTHAIYAVRHDEEDGVTAIYHNNRGVPANSGKYHGPIAGFDAEDLGLLEDAPMYRTRLDFFGNFVCHSPYAIARLSHFTV